eukprot:CAMPEP_0206033114 /NCGR_PEP_ID=MMETSP1466-20131121/406_1 /ASSEMBLY_ACC=CAM_ASM_001126 /TAXON_ID=44452 /ORGANISM="Pavlova gyrans, Strain CCMP608" /LENGTH=46 /DNA_ID= /DNA_START= /DNA_END= /DNA_ORIENTATION=
MRAVAAFVSQHAQEMNGVVPKTYRDNSTINVKPQSTRNRQTLPLFP